MSVRRAAVVTSGLLLLGAAAGALPNGKPVNIKVLPKDISAAEIGQVMKRFEADLGVKCGHCHVEDTTTQKLNYASDDNPAKNTTRLMIAMLKDINEKYLPLLGTDSRYAAQVTCGSCHQGQSSPPAFD
jgi:hypothetical protein